MREQHRHAEQTGEQCERRQQPQQVAGVERAHAVVEMERYPQQHVADRHAHDQRRNETTDEQHPVPIAAPARAHQFAAELEADRAQDQREQDQEHRQIKPGEAHCIQRWERGKDRAAAQDQPHLVAFPDRADGIVHQPAFGIVVGDERQQRAHAQIEAAHHRVTGQQYAEQQPPDHAQGCVIEQYEIHDVSPSLRVRCRPRHRNSAVRVATWRGLAGNALVGRRATRWAASSGTTHPGPC